MRCLPTLVLSTATLFVLSSQVKADVVVNFVESGGNVLSSASGSIDFGSITPTSGIFSQTARVAPAGADFNVGPAVVTPVDFYTDSSGTGPLSFGTGGTTNADTGSGDFFGLSGGGIGISLFLPSGYASGTPIASASSYTGQSFTDLGITPGSYSYSAGPNTITLNVGAVAVPEPAGTSCMILSSMIVFCVRRRRNR